MLAGGFIYTTYVSVWMGCSL